MAMLDLAAFDRATLERDPCDFVVVPGFLKHDALEAVNRDYPEIDEPGNFDPEKLTFGPAFAALLEELNSPQVKARFAEKFQTELTENPLQMTVRKYSENTDGNVHNDSKGKIITALIYFNKEWHHEGGKLRLLRSSWNIDEYAAEVTPAAGNLVAFRRSENSFHGFKRCEGERRSLQMYWVKPKRAARGDEKTISLKKRVKRLLKHRPRWGS